MIILYHANCNDGSASALAAWLKLGDEGHQYIPVTHGTAPPDEVIGEDVVIVDFCYPREVLVAMQAKSIVILDHHISAKNDLAEPFDQQCNITAHFDMNRSGATITWSYFFPDQPIPRLFSLIQDRDIWTNQFPEASSLNYGLSIFPPDFRLWKSMVDSPDALDQTITTGESIEQFVQQQINLIIRTRDNHNIAGFEVPTVNAPSFILSDLLHQILDLEPNAPFAAGFTDNLKQGIRNYSLRSDNSREDVSLIAKSFGGGGHRNAAAFNIPLVRCQQTAK